MRPLSVRRLTFSALIAAIYAVITITTGAIAYGPIQFRIAEALCILPFFLPFTTWGLFVGCILANLRARWAFWTSYSAPWRRWAAACAPPPSAGVGMDRAGGNAFSPA